jgi:hypothetical protein
MRSIVVLLFVATVAGCTSEPSPAPQDKHVNERTREWIRAGTKELGSDAVPSYVRGKGFGPDSLPNPTARPRQTQ